MSGPPGPGATRPAADARTPRPRATTSGTGSAKNSPGSGSQGPVRPAWPATAGPAGDGSRFRRQVRPRRDGGRTSRTQPGHRRGTGRRDPRPETAQTARPGRPEDDEQAERPAAGESGWDRMVPPYVDDLTRPRRDRSPPRPAPATSSPEKALRPRPGAAGMPGQDAGSVWSAWSSSAPPARKNRPRAAAATFVSRASGTTTTAADRDERRGRDEQASRAESGIPNDDIPDDGMSTMARRDGLSASDLAGSGATAGALTSGGAAPGDEIGEDEVAPAGPGAAMAGDDRAGAGAAEPAAPGATPDAARRMPRPTPPVRMRLSTATPRTDEAPRATPKAMRPNRAPLKRSMPRPPQPSGRGR